MDDSESVNDPNIEYTEVGIVAQKIRLKKSQLEIYNWAYIEGRDNREIAGFLKVSVEKVKDELTVIRGIFAAIGRVLPKRRMERSKDGRPTIPDDIRGAKHRGKHGRAIVECGE